jgi:hypothetical protein
MPHLSGVAGRLNRLPERSRRSTGERQSKPFPLPADPWRSPLPPKVTPAAPATPPTPPTKSALADQPPASLSRGPLVPLESPWQEGSRYRSAYSDQRANGLELYFEDPRGPWLRLHGVLLAANIVQSPIAAPTAPQAASPAVHKTTNSGAGFSSLARNPGSQPASQVPSAADVAGNSQGHLTRPATFTQLNLDLPIHEYKYEY